MDPTSSLLGTIIAPSELAAPESAMSAPADNGATDIVDTEVGGDDSPLSSASPEVVRLPRWDDLGRSYTLNHNLVHKFIPNFSFKGTVHHHPNPPTGSRYRACRALRSRIDTAQLMGIGSALPPHELRGGSRDDWAPVKGPCSISSRI